MRLDAQADWQQQDLSMEIAALQDELESVSAFYGERHDIERTDDWFMLKLGEEVGELMQAYLARAGQSRDKGRSGHELEEDFQAELADVLAQTLLIARHFDVDLEAAIKRKWMVWKPEVLAAASRGGVDG